MDGILPELPYPGLRAFGRDESLLFFGRENCVDQMIERLAATRFLAVLGASGSGKSSLVRTGLFDGLELGFFARAGAQWKIVDMHPGGAPMRNLAAALAQSRTETGKRDPVNLVQALLERGPRSLVEWARGGNLEPGENLLVFVDQFEELFRYGDYAAREEAEAFVALLLESARNQDAPIYLVITMRSEYLGACALVPGLAEQVNSGFYLTPRMTREECRQAIEGPAAVMEFGIEPSLVNQILNDMASFAPWEEETGVAQSQILSRRADQLPLMQHLLNQLWLRARERESVEAIQLKLEDYAAVGGLSGALNSHGAKVFASLPDADRSHVQTVFRALVSGPDPTNAVRRPCRLRDLQAEAEERGAGGGAAAARVVNAFRAAGCSFLQPVPSIPLSGELVVDISHESLIRQWSDLAAWLRDEARAEANWRRLLTSAERNAAGESELLAGVDLAALAQWWDAEKPNPAWADRHGGGFEAARTFLDRSRAARNEADARRIQQAKRERRRLMMTLTIVTGLLVVSIGAIGFALVLGFNVQNAQAAVAAAERSMAATEIKRRDAEMEITKQRAAEEALKQMNAEATAAIAEQQKKVAEMEEKIVLIGSVAGHPATLNDTIRYCQEHRNEPACDILFGRAPMARGSAN